MKVRTCAAAPTLGLVILAWPVWQASAQTTQGAPGTSPVVSAVSAPPGTEALGVQWVHVGVPGGRVMLAAVARPSGAGPFPTVLLLHGSHGFAQEYVRLARDLAEGGLLAVAACWFQGGGGRGARFVTAIGGPEAPPMPTASSPASAWVQTVQSLLQAARTLPGAHPDRIGIFGHSRGGVAALNYLSQEGDVQAVVLNSSGYSSAPSERASQVKAPVLILHGTADSPEDGGGPSTNVQMARNFEAALREAGKAVEAVYYEGGRHNDVFTSATQYRAEVQQMLTFFLRYLRL